MREAVLPWVGMGSCPQEVGEPESVRNSLCRFDGVGWEGYSMQRKPQTQREKGNEIFGKMQTGINMWLGQRQSPEGLVRPARSFDLRPPALEPLMILSSRGTCLDEC